MVTATVPKSKYDEAVRENRRLRFEIRLGQLVAGGYRRRSRPADAAYFATEKCDVCDHVGLGVHCFHLRRNGCVISIVGFYHCPNCESSGEF